MYKNLPIHFITGVPRSGTTLLGQLLSSNKSIAYFYELTIASYMLNKTYNHFNIKYSNFDDKTLDISYKNSIQHFYNNAMVSSFGKRKAIQFDCIIDKDPTILPYIDKIFSILPTSKIVHIIHDPYCVCQSYISKINSIEESDVRKSWGKIDDDHQDDDDEPHIRAAKIWKKYAANTQRYKTIDLNKRYFEITYEDLVQNPLTSCNEIFSFLNLHNKMNKETIDLANINRDKNISAKQMLTEKQMNEIAAIIK